MTECPPRLHKPRLCVPCRAEPWPAFVVGFPDLASETPAELRGVYLWHCPAPADPAPGPLFKD
ncbi:hypothetical protein [Paracoccus ravus]|uniref:hypothetical protein n=1 Tax=Paracoccus ravus TaxID=2447760 RepID=UPI00106E133E|nr:hypothetical protein [Paracoccus ravus]